MDKLKPCPFCGGTDITVCGGINIGIVRCRSCDVSICRMIDEDTDFWSHPEIDYREEVIEAWNRRAEHEKPL